MKRNLLKEDVEVARGFETWWESLGFPPRSYCVYVMCDEEQQPLWAGMTTEDNLKSRMRGHHKTKPWIEEVARIDIVLSGPAVSKKDAKRVEDYWNHHREPKPKYGKW